MAMSEMAVSEDVVAPPMSGVLLCSETVCSSPRHKIYLLRGCGYESDPGMSKSFFRTRGREDVVTMA